MIRPLPVLLSAALAISATSASQAQEGPIGRLPLSLIHLLQEKITAVQFADAVVATTRSNGPNPGDDFEIASTRGLWRAAQARATAVAPILEYDIDGDLEVNASEIRYVVEFNAAVPSFPPRPADAGKVIADLMKGDLNHDGKITLPEIIAGVQISKGVADYALIHALLSLDPNKDGTLAEDELRGLANAAYAAADQDGDGVLSGAEAARAQAMATPPFRCKAKAAPAVCEVQ